jgi:hypothetical protein
MGVWRSGTSLLYSLLNQHSDIALLYEGDLPLFWPLFLGRRRDWPSRWNFWNSALDRHQLTDASELLGEAADIRVATELACRAYASRKQASIWGDKSPTYSGRAIRLARLFPEARFLFIWRDPADICSSIARAGRSDRWLRRTGMLNRSLFACESVKKDYDSLAQKGVAVHQLTYQELVGNTAEAMRGICEFLGVSYDPRMISLEGADRSAIYQGEHHDLVKGKDIRESRNRSEVLSPAIQNKLARYKNLWASRYGADWPLAPRAADSTFGKPGLLERLADRIACRAYRFWDSVVMIIYCFAPLSLLGAYRNVRNTKPSLPYPGA